MRTFIIFLFLLFLLVGCNSETIYLTGSIVNEKGVGVAVLWKNGKIIELTDGTKGAHASSIFISNDDVYVCVNETGKDGIVVPMLWKNDKLIKLSKSNQSTYAKAVFVSGNDVYIIENRTPKNGGCFAVLWKNGEESFISGKSEYSRASSIFVADKDVYITGNDGYFGESDQVATLWKNKQKISLSSRYAEATSVLVSEKNIYVAGRISSLGFDYKTGEQAVIWKNGKMTYLSNNAYDAGAYYVFMKDDKINAIGVETSQERNSQIVLWEDGNSIPLSDWTGSVGLASACIFKNNIYTVGIDVEKDNEIILWKNKKEYKRINNSLAMVTSICVN